MKINLVDIPVTELGEGALWDAEARALFYLDIVGQTVFRHDPESGRTDSWAVPGNVGALGLCRGNRAILGMGDTLDALDFASGAVSRLAGPVFDNPGVVINDGTVDRVGRFVFGGCSAGIDNPRPVGGLFTLDASGRVARLDCGVYQSNSHCFSPDGKTLYCADSYQATLFAYDYDTETGTVSAKRAFTNTQALGGVPDGSAVDADGLVWVSIFKGAKVVAYRPDGKLERVIDLPVSLISSVAWGGRDLDRLYVTTIDPAVFGWAREDGGGGLFAIEGLGTRGVPESRYAGQAVVGGQG